MATEKALVELRLSRERSRLLTSVLRSVRDLGGHADLTLEQKKAFLRAVKKEATKYLKCLEGG